VFFSKWRATYATQNAFTGGRFNATPSTDSASQWSLKYLGDRMPSYDM